MGVSTDPATRDFLRFRATGRPAHLARVFDAVAQELLLVATHLVAPGSAAPEDLVQATFLKAIEAADDFDGARRVQPWLIGILTNEARAARRRARRRPDPDRLGAPVASDPSAVAEDTEFAAAVRSAILELPDPYRDALTLRLVHGLTPTQIAHALGQPPGTVKSWLHRGLARLRALLPSGFAASLAVYVEASDGLAAVRGEVVRAAAQRVPVTLLPGGWFTALALLAIVTAGFFWWWGDRAPGPEEGESRVAAAAATTEEKGRVPARTPSDVESVAAPGLHVFTLLADGDPLPAAVYLRPGFGPDPELRGLWVETGSDGYAHVEGLASGTWEVVLDRGGSTEARVVAGGVATVRLRASRVPELRGVVRLRSGEPVADAELWLTMEGSLSEGHVVGRTDGRGEFALAGIPASRALSAQKDGFMTGGLHAVPAPGERGGNELFEVEVRGAGARVRGVVTDAHGQPVPGARVMLGSPAVPQWDLEMCDGMRLRPPITVWTDEVGAFSVRTAAPNRATSLWVRAPGFAPRHVRLHVPEAAGEKVVKTTLVPGARCTGVAESAAGTAVAGARMRADHAGSIHRPALDQSPAWVAPVARSGADGTFELQGVPAGWARLSGEGPSGDLWAARVHQVEEAAMFWRAVLGRGSSLAGRLRTEDGAPLEGWQIVASAVAAPAAIATTDSEGHFVVRELEDRPYTVTVKPPANRTRDDDSTVDVPEDRPTPALTRSGVRPGEHLDLRVKASAQPRCLVRAAIAGASERTRVATLTAVDGGTWHAALSETGQIEVGPVPSGTYYLSLDHADGMDLLHGPFAVGTTVRTDVDLGLLVVEPPGRVRVQLRTQGELPADMVQVSIYSPDGGMTPTVLALTEGRGTSWFLPPGRYLVTLEDPRLATVQAAVDVAPGKVTDVVLEEPVTRSVVLTWPDHPAFEGMCRVRFALVEQASGSRYQLPIGARCVPGRPLGVRLRLPPGRYRVEGTSALGAASGVFEVEPHQETEPVVLR